MIEFKDVSFQYEQGGSKGRIENINLTIHDGEVVLICGESGCGKTTFTRLINGLIPHYYEGTLTGQTIVEGIDVPAGIPDKQLQGQCEKPGPSSDCAVRRL